MPYYAHIRQDENGETIYQTVAEHLTQDHPLTSPLFGGGTVITPSTRLARKNFGVMFAGSL